MEPITIPHIESDVVKLVSPAADFFPCTLNIPSKYSGLLSPRIEPLVFGSGSQHLALEYHPEGEIAAKDAVPSPKKKRHLRGKRRGKIKEHQNVLMEYPAGLYDLGASFSDISEGSQESLEDPESKKRRIEDELWEEAVLKSVSASQIGVSAECKEVPPEGDNL